MLKKIVFGTILFAGTACSSVYQLTIDVLEPAPITLPGNVDHILIVNNTTPQANDIGINRIYNDQLITAYELNLDSISWTVIEALSDIIRDSDFFDKVSLYKHRVRTDQKWMSTIRLPENFRNRLFEMQDFDAIISIDKLLFNVEEEVKGNIYESSGDYLSAFVNNKVEGRLGYSIYLYEKTMSELPFTLTDSAVYKNTLMADSLEFFKILPEAIINDVAYSLGEKLAYSIIPAWTAQKRTIYTGSHSRMQEALSYSKKGKWDQAESIWLRLFNQESKNVQKAKLSHNLAVASEMQDKPESALLWEEKAKEYFPVGSNEEIEASEYISTLRRRIQNNHLLDIQVEEKINY
jgi:tetratricopeptide (TPR) repeat protein